MPSIFRNIRTEDDEEDKKRSFTEIVQSEREASANSSGSRVKPVNEIPRSTTSPAPRRKYVNELPTASTRSLSNDHFYEDAWAHQRATNGLMGSYRSAARAAAEEEARRTAAVRESLDRELPFGTYSTTFRRDEGKDLVQRAAMNRAWDLAKNGPEQTKKVDMREVPLSELSVPANLNDPFGAAKAEDEHETNPLLATPDFGPAEIATPDVPNFNLPDLQRPKTRYDSLELPKAPVQTENRRDPEEVANEMTAAALRGPNFSYSNTRPTNKIETGDAYTDRVINRLFDTDGKISEYIKAHPDADLSLLDEAMLESNGVETPREVASDPTRHWVKASPIERSVAFYLANTGQNEKLTEYVNALKPVLEKRTMQDAINSVQEFAGKNPFNAALMSAASVLMAPTRGVSYIGQAIDMAGDGKIDEYADYNMFSRVPDAIRNKVSSDIADGHGAWGKFGAFGYQTAMSMGDFLYTALVSGGFSGGLTGSGTAAAQKASEALSLGIMGTGAAASSTIEAKERGLSDKQAFALGTIAGLAEVVTEKVSLEALLKPDYSQGALKYILKNALAEGSEEVASDLINVVADTLIAADKSKLRERVNQLVAEEGISESEAFGRALAEQAGETALSFLGGAISGGVMAGAGSAINWTNFQQAKQEFAAANGMTTTQVDTLTDILNDTDTERQSARLNALAKDVAGETRSNLDRAARLYAEEQQARTAEGRIALVEQELAQDPAAQNIGEAGRRIISENWNGNQRLSGYVGDMITAYNAGRGGELNVGILYDGDLIRNNTDRSRVERAFEAGKTDMKADRETIEQNYNDIQRDASENVQSMETISEPAQDYAEAHSVDIASTNVPTDNVADYNTEDNYGRETYYDNGAERYASNDSGVETQRVAEEPGIAFRGASTETTQQFRGPEQTSARGLSTRVGKIESTELLGKTVGVAGNFVTFIDPESENTPAVVRRMETLASYLGMKPGSVHSYTGTLYREDENMDMFEVHGFVDASIGDIYICVDDPVQAERTFRHEATHLLVAANKISVRKVMAYMQTTAPKAYKDIMTVYASAYAGSGMSLEDIWGEAIADAMAGINIEVREGSVFWNALDKYMPSVRKAVADIHGITGDVFTEAYHTETDTSQNGTNAPPIYKDILASLGENAKAQYTKNGDLVIAENEDQSTVLYSNRTLSKTQSALAKILYEKGYSDADVKRALNIVSDQAAMLNDIFSETEYSYLGEALDADVHTDIRGRQVLRAIVKNGEYPVNIDFLTICKKRQAYSSLLSKLLNEGIFDQIQFDADAIAMVNEELRNAGFETACLMCFVESRRQQIQKWATTFRDDWNAAVDKALGGKKAGDWNFYKGKRGEYRLTNNEALALSDQFEKASAKLGKNDKENLKLGQGSVPAKMATLLKNMPSLAKHLSTADLLTPEGFENLSRVSPELRSLLLQHYGSNTPKPVQEFTPYNGEIGELSGNFMAKVVGESIPGLGQLQDAAKKKISAEAMAAFEEQAKLALSRKADSILDQIEDKTDTDPDAVDKLWKEYKKVNPTKANIKREVNNLVNQWSAEEAIQKYLFDIGGVRLQSFSDYLVENTLDYYQLFADLAAKEFPLHAYTKEITFARLFGMTGAKINLSLIARLNLQSENAGLNPDGTYAGWSDYYNHAVLHPDEYIQSVGYKDAVALMMDPRYSSNVGTIAIGVSPAQIRKMLSDPYIRMVIPYHASGMNPTFAQLMHIDRYRDSTQYQNTAYGQMYDLDGNPVDTLTVGNKEMSGAQLRGTIDKFLWDETLQRVGDPKKAADEYLAWCARRHDIVVDGKTIGQGVYKPMFSGDYAHAENDFTNEENYYKLLENFTTKDAITEENAPQKAVQMLYPNQENVLSGKDLSDYEKRLREAKTDTGEKLFSEKDIAKYVKWAQQSSEDIIRAEVKSRKEYHDVQDAKLESETYPKIKARLQSRDFRFSAEGRQLTDEEQKKALDSIDDNVYMSAIESGDMKTAQKMVDDAAKKVPTLALDKSGKPLHLYHGTRYFGFTIYKDPNYKTPFIYTSTKREVSAHYAGDNNYAGVREIGEKYDGGDSLKSIIKDAKYVWGTTLKEATYADKERIFNKNYSEAKKIADKIDELYTTFDIPWDTEDGQRIGNAIDRISDMFFIMRDGDVSTYSEATQNRDWGKYLLSDVERFEDDSKVVREYFSDNYKSFTDDQKKLLRYLTGYELGDAAIDIGNMARMFKNDALLINMNDGLLVPAETRDALDRIHSIGAYDLYGDLGDNPYEFDANGAQFWALKVSDIGTDYYDTDTVSKWARNNGYTSVIMRNIYDYGDKADNYVFFNPNQIKSADPVTYDEDGNVIPLSERFNKENDDIRYSTKGRGLSDEEQARALMAGVQTDDVYRELTDTINDLRAELRKQTARAEHFKAETRLSQNRGQVDEASAEKFTRSILKAYESKADFNTTKAGVTEYANWMRKTFNELRTVDDAVRWADFEDEAYTRAVDLMRPVVLNTETLLNEDAVEIGKDIRSYLKSGRGISISDADQRAVYTLGYDNFQDFRKRNFGNLKITKDGPRVDQVWSELQDQYGKDFFPDDIYNSLEQLERISEVLSELEPIYGNPFVSNAFNAEEAVDYAARDVVSRVLRGEVKEVAPTFSDKMHDRIDAAQKEAVRRVQEVRQEARAKTEEKLNALKSHYAEMNKNRSTLSQMSKERQRLLKIARRLMNRKMPAVNKAWVEETIGNLDLAATSITGRKIKNLMDLSDWYEEQKQNPDFIPMPQIEKQLQRLVKRQMGSARDAFNAQKAGLGFDGMTQEEVLDLTEALLNFEHQLDTRDKLINSEDRRSVYAMTLEVLTDIENSRGINIGRDSKLYMGVRNYAVDENLNPRSTFRRIAGYNENDPLYQRYVELNEGQHAMMTYEMNALGEFDEWMNDKEFQRDHAGRHAKTVTATFGGKEVTMTRDVLISLYMHSLNDQNMRHIARSGIDIPDAQMLRKNNLQRAYEKTTRVRIQPSEMKAFFQNEGKLTDKEMSFIRAMQKYFEETSKKDLNRVSLDLYGFERANEENYWPIEVNTNFLRQDANALFKLATTTSEITMDPGFLQERKVESGEVIIGRGALDVLQSAIHKNANFIGMAIPIRNFSKLYSTKSVSFEELPSFRGQAFAAIDQGSVRDLIQKKWGEQANKYIVKLMNDMQGLRVKDEGRFVQTLRMFRSNYAGAVLTFNLSVALKQTASYPTAAAVIGWRPLLQAFKLTYNEVDRVDLDLIKKYTPLLDYRRKGFTDSERGEMAQRNIHVPAALNWIQGMDVLTTQKLWRACEYYVQDNFKALERRSDPYYRKVAEIYNRVIEETQPNYTTMQRPGNLRGDFITTSLNMFKTQPYQNFNILYDAFGTFAAKRRALKTATDENIAQAKEDFKQARTHLWNSVSSIAVSTIVFAVATFAWALGRRKKKLEDAGEEMAKSMVSSLIGMVPLLNIPLDLISAHVFDEKYWGYETVTAGSINDFTEGVDKIITAWEDGKQVKVKDVANLAFSVSQLFGLPLSNVVNLLNIGFAWAGLGSLQDFIQDGIAPSDANYVWEQRRKAGVTTKQIAEACGVQESTVRGWQSGKIPNMKKESKEKLAGLLGISVNELNREIELSKGDD